MNQGYTFRKFGAAASTKALTITGGTVLRGIWVTAKGTSPSITVYDDVASVASSVVISGYVPAAVGWNEMGGIGLSKGLTVKTASVTCLVVYQPSWS